MTIDQAGVLADPAETGVACKRTFQDRRGIDEGAIAERSDIPCHAIRQFLQSTAHELVVVATQCIARDIGPVRIGEHVEAIARVLGKVVHPHGDDAQRTGQKFLRTAALAAMLGHVVHFAMASRIEPVQQMGFVLF